eukprot:TRINITY_DN123757_c0_g1_i1.p1 TRINITY_DN123757_c0_g1~~TRINITY_DN123757_c0_g1_i1.p1  ORF type:complete len:307 (+),score=51.58 TRINITY_DN123757_c0_g1_i1:82-1002(+)
MERLRSSLVAIAQSICPVVGPPPQQQLRHGNDASSATVSNQNEPAVLETAVVNVTVVDLLGETLAVLECQPSLTGEKLRSNIAKQLGKRACQIELLRQGATLEDKLSLQAQGFHDEVELNLVSKPLPEVQIQTLKYKGQRNRQDHWYGTDAQGRGFHSTKEDQDQNNWFAESPVTVQTWSLVPALNGREDAFSMESKSNPGSYFFVRLHAQRERIAGGRSHSEGPNVWLVDTKEATNEPDSASFMATAAPGGRGVCICPCSLPTTYITHGWARLSPEEKRASGMDPSLFFIDDKEIPVDEVLAWFK